MGRPCPSSQTLHAVCPGWFLSQAQPQLCELWAVVPALPGEEGRCALFSTTRPRPALRKQDPPTNPSTLRLRSLFPGPLLVRVHNWVHRQDSCHSRFSCVQEGSWYQHHVTLLGLHIEAKWWPLGLELLFRSDLSGGLHCVLIFTAALRQLCSQGVKTVLTYLTKEEKKPLEENA